MPEPSFSPVVFPAIDRPSGAFTGAMERALAAVSVSTTVPSAAFRLAQCADGDCREVQPYAASALYFTLGKQRGLAAMSGETRNGLVETAYGGTSADTPGNPARATSLGTRLGDRVLRLLVDSVSSATLLPLDVQRSPTHREQPLSPHTPMRACTFAVEWNGHLVGSAVLCLPLRGLAETEQSGAVRTEDRDWRDRMERVLGTVRVPVRCVLGRPTLSAGLVATLEPGTVLPIPALSDVSLIAAGYRIASGCAELRDGDAVVRIKHTEILQ